MCAGGDRATEKYSKVIWGEGGRGVAGGKSSGAGPLLCQNHGRWSPPPAWHTWAVTVGKTGMLNCTGKPAPRGTFVSKKRLKFSECRPVRANISATGRNASAWGGGAGVGGGGW
jgi:hypothetical protein